MKLRVVSVCHNERELLPWYLRHYEQYADQIVLYDDDSDDGTQTIAVCSDRVSLRPCPFKGLVDDKMMALWQTAMSEALRDGFDWIAFPDIDEFLWHQGGLRAVIERSIYDQAEVIPSEGWNMVGDGLPKDDGHSQIWHTLQTGVPAPVYSKPIIVKVGAKVNWNRGRHALENCTPRMSRHKVKLLHYRYLGYDYTVRRNARNYARVGSDKGCAWSCSPTYQGEHSAKWAEEMKAHALSAISPI